MKNFLPILSLLFVLSCGNDNVNADFTGNSVSLNLIPGSVQGNETNGIVEIRETSDGFAQINIELYNVLNNANHPVHLHFGSLADDGNVATILNPIIESEGTGFSQTIINELEDGTKLNYSELLNFDGSIKIHFEASGHLENEILGSTNIGNNVSQNQAYLDGIKSIVNCNSSY